MEMDFFYKWIFVPFVAGPKGKEMVAWIAKLKP